MAFDSIVKEKYGGSLDGSQYYLSRAKSSAYVTPLCCFQISTKNVRTYLMNKIFHTIYFRSLNYSMESM